MTNQGHPYNCLVGMILFFVAMNGCAYINGMQNDSADSSTESLWESDSLTESEHDSLTETPHDSLTESEHDSLTETPHDSLTESEPDSLTESEPDSLTETPPDSLTETESTDVDTTTHEPEPTCYDGIQNGLETGLDCGGDCAQCLDPIYSSPTPDISIPKGCFAPNEYIQITKHNPSNNPSMDWIWVPEDENWWAFMPYSEYLYQASDKIGSYELKFYWDDADDEYWRSRLTFKVSNSCP